MENKSYFWFRRDLRLNDNHGLFRALISGNSVIPVFIFDTNILNELPKSDARVEFIHNQLMGLKNELKKLGSDLEIWVGNPLELWQIKLKGIHSLYLNHDYEPYAIERDLEVQNICNERNIEFHSFKDQVIFEKHEIVKDDGKPYTVYTPYMKKWKLTLNNQPIEMYPSENHVHAFEKFIAENTPSLEELGFIPSGIEFPKESVEQGIIKNYEFQRDIPSIRGTSRLSLHFRFGTISVREKVLKAMRISEKWLNELIWREFYMQILYHFPHVCKSSFKPQYDLIQWENNLNDFERWKSGTTGYPIVDAGMRELNATGFMHNRVRMIVASFLTKHLLIDWRWGEAYFAEKLLDYELASNNGGWQWAAGSGVDAAPYFRVFNPQLQTEKFDSKFEYIKQWIPEFGTPRYPKPIIEHAFARNRCLERYKSALSS